MSTVEAMRCAQFSGSIATTGIGDCATDPNVTQWRGQEGHPGGRCGGAGTAWGRGGRPTRAGAFRMPLLHHGPAPMRAGSLAGASPRPALKTALRPATVAPAV